MDKKLKRSHNFTAYEVALLIALVKERTSEIECRKSDTDTNKIKNEARAHVCQKFNSHLKQSICRDVDVLKNKYNNEKKKYADEKRHLYAPKQNNLRSNLGRWASSKQALAALQIECFKKEHDLKLKHAQEKLDEFIRLQRLEFEARIRLITNGNLPNDIQTKINCSKP
ncbi:unnamed protein product [Psylliodes chrysocephalus]|uniref:Regulatory protein zeste n=1 Tax=Psylliodes chrysocephalus TaxID=3402493 RepID=A0A9P0G950_9CUCU|nr:unnamed protein product [Psylliodes chrysocephala]